MSKRKTQIALVVIFAMILAGVLVGTFSRPAPVKVSVTFAGFTIAPSPYASNGGFQITNALFSLSNAGTAKVQLTFRDYVFKSGSKLIFMHSDLGVLCFLKPGQSTNLILPTMANDVSGLGPDYRWKVEISSKRNWVATLDRQPQWLQSVVMKAIPKKWLGDIYRRDVVSDWITNREPTPAFPKLINVSPLSNTNRGAP